MRVPLLAVVLLVAGSEPGLAQPGSVTIGLGSGIAAATTQELRSATDRDLSVSGHVTVELSSGLALRGEIGRHELNTDTPAFDFCNDLGHRCEGDLRLTNFSAGIQYGGFGGQGPFGLSGGRLQPYGFVTAGVYQATELVLQQAAGNFTITAATPQPAIVDVAESHFGLNAGGGLNVRLNRYLGVHGDVHLHRVRLNDSGLPVWVSFVTPSVGIWVAF